MFYYLLIEKKANTSHFLHVIFKTSLALGTTLHVKFANFWPFFHVGLTVLPLNFIKFRRQINSTQIISR